MAEQGIKRAAAEPLGDQPAAKHLKNDAGNPIDVELEDGVFTDTEVDYLRVCGFPVVGQAGDKSEAVARNREWFRAAFGHPLNISIGTRAELIGMAICAARNWRYRDLDGFNDGSHTEVYAEAKEAPFLRGITAQFDAVLQKLETKARRRIFTFDAIVFDYQSLVDDLKARLQEAMRAELAFLEARCRDVMPWCLNEEGQKRVAEIARVKELRCLKPSDLKRIMVIGDDRYNAIMTAKAGGMYHAASKDDWECFKIAVRLLLVQARVVTPFDTLIRHERAQLSGRLLAMSEVSHFTGLVEHRFVKAQMDAMFALRRRGEQLLAQVEKWTDGDKRPACVICHSNVAKFVLDPCGHHVWCELCQEQALAGPHTCPLCRVPFAKDIRVYFA